MRDPSFPVAPITNIIGRGDFDLTLLFVLTFVAPNKESLLVCEVRKRDGIMKVPLMGVHAEDETKNKTNSSERLLSDSFILESNKKKNPCNHAK